MTASLLKWARKAGASLFFIGYFPVASGTVASAVTTALIWFLSIRFPKYFGAPSVHWYWALIIALGALSVFLSSKAKENFGSEDPSPVVIDEVVGQFITFFMVPLTVPNLVTGFLLFRFFDIVKPFPVFMMEELDDGVGITMDDVMAGVWANISLLAIHFFYHLMRSAIT
jgi:phosphatidylglycerophosphatase A